MAERGRHLSRPAHRGSAARLILVDPEAAGQTWPPRHATTRPPRDSVRRPVRRCEGGRIGNVVSHASRRHGAHTGAPGRGCGRNRRVLSARLDARKRRKLPPEDCEAWREKQDTVEAAEDTQRFVELRVQKAEGAVTHAGIRESESSKPLVFGRGQDPSGGAKGTRRGDGLDGGGTRRGSNSSRSGRPEGRSAGLRRRFQRAEEGRRDLPGPRASLGPFRSGRACCPVGEGGSDGSCRGPVPLRGPDCRPRVFAFDVEVGRVGDSRWGRGPASRRRSMVPGSPHGKGVVTDRPATVRGVSDGRPVR